MIIGGNYAHHFQMGPQSPGQAMQATLEAGSQANDAFVQKTSGNIVHNQQQAVNTLRDAFGRGQAFDMYV